MDVVSSLQAFNKPARGCVLCIGNFDGVHLGHQRMLSAAREAANQHQVPLVVQTFEPHPIASLRPNQVPPRLVTHERKLELLNAQGVDTVIVIGPDTDFFKLTPEAFIQHLIQHCDPRSIVEGPTFGFGADRAGNVDTLRKLGEKYNIEVKIVERLSLTAASGDSTISSSKIRATISSGNVSLAAKKLSRFHEISGFVGHGAGRGAGLGFPTVNLEQISELIPGDGVYAGLATLSDGARKAAAINIGGQPTFESSNYSVEAFLLDHHGSLRGEKVRLAFVQRLRSQVRFEGIEALKVQLNADVQHVRESTASHL